MFDVIARSCGLWTCSHARDNIPTGYLDFTVFLHLCNIMYGLSVKFSHNFTQEIVDLKT